MKLILKGFGIVLATIILLFFQGKTNATDRTYDDAVESFRQYEKSVQDFIHAPTDKQMSAIYEYDRQFLADYYVLIEHQTLYNKVLANEPLLTVEELAYLHDLHRKEEQLDHQFIQVALKEVFQASDFSLLLKEADEHGDYHSEYIDIHKTENNEKFEIRLDGTLFADDSSVLLRRFFFIETKAGIYYWEKPDNFSMMLNRNEGEIQVERNTYVFQGEIVY
ncbi:hypothetical protein JCM9140_3551 [Halalkalibacter wakoensis JCM 9140]|uniref:Uncharacterized protein n=1 Tax=Halalkalibacter wakoensis JCM 9140 TaxID=1236970 RepID=W4Q5S9_9BACI|nr:hypothetical protein [Halalkalibacter wakoensis]GAE27406.1 hypothetical protein JCM9140_3551 [Halalkalibacter wakoensis JCM 9140]